MLYVGKWVAGWQRNCIENYVIEFIIHLKLYLYLVVTVVLLCILCDCKCSVVGRKEGGWVATHLYYHLLLLLM